MTLESSFDRAAKLLFLPVFVTLVAWEAYFDTYAEVVFPTGARFLK